ncbi:MAG: acylphosphatase [Candidatus Binataceae bacterium]
MAADKAQVRMVVSGRVQGVGFRYAAIREAQGLGLTGWVRNLPGGRVEILAEGWRKNLGMLVAWAHQGPAAAQVGAVEVEWSDYEGKLQGFEVR